MEFSKKRKENAKEEEDLPPNNPFFTSVR